MGRALQLACTCASLSLGCSTSGFACADDPQCGAQGVCEPEGWCSFPDEMCTSGRRFGEHAGGGLASRCVPMHSDMSTGSGDPTVASTLEGSTGSPTATSMVDDGSTTPISSTTETGDDVTTVGGDASTGTPIDDGPLVWLAFDDVMAPFDDASGNGNHGQCDPQQCPMVVPGVLGSALRFDGLDDRLAVIAGDGLMSFEAITIAVYVDVDMLELATYQDVIAKTLGDASLNSFGIGFPNTSASLRVVMNDGTELAEVGGIVWPEDGGWHHVATTWDGEVARLYFDGAMIGEAPITALALDGHPLMIGADINGRVEGNYFGGQLDDVRIYRRALAEDEIAALLPP